MQEPRHGYTMHRWKWKSQSRTWGKSHIKRSRKREETREKRDGAYLEERHGGEKGRALGETREERKEKREERDNHNQDERAEEGNSGPRREEERAQIIERSSEQLHCNCTATGFALSRVCILIRIFSTISSVSN